MREPSAMVEKLVCVNCGAEYFPHAADAPQVWMTCPACGPSEGILDFRYDLAAVRAGWAERPLATRALSHWRYAELLPLAPSFAAAGVAGGVDPVGRSPAVGGRVGTGAAQLQRRRTQSVRFATKIGPARWGSPMPSRWVRPQSPALRPAMRPPVWPAMRPWPGSRPIFLCRTRLPNRSWPSCWSMGPACLRLRGRTIRRTSSAPRPANSSAGTIAIVRSIRYWSRAKKPPDWKSPSRWQARRHARLGGREHRRWLHDCWHLEGTVRDAGPGCDRPTCRGCWACRRRGWLRFRTH